MLFRSKSSCFLSGAILCLFPSHDKKGNIKYTKKLFEDIKKSADGESVEKTLKKTLNSSAFKGLNRSGIVKKQEDFSGGFNPVY